jgi:DNA-binding NtrC family response regulator
MHLCLAAPFCLCNSPRTRHHAAMPQTPASRLLRDYLASPFAGAAAPTVGQARAALRDVSLAELVEAALRRGDTGRASELALAAAHAESLAGLEPDALLDERALPRSLARRLPHPRHAYVRVAAAAGRCARVLATIRGTSPAIQRARGAAWTACFGGSLAHALELERVIHDQDVVILGETGTGKELFARAMQQATPGGESGGPAPSSAINAAAIPETLVESELFGHARGAFTGATESRVGRLRSADGGSFFLDEVGDLPSPTQTKLLRVIETNEVYPVGSDTGYTVAIRYIAGTHKDLEGMVERGEFRRDLFERLAGTVVRVPPLRERPLDVVEIGMHFAATYLPPGASARRAAIESWLRSREAQSHSWPGNVRELQNALRNLLLGSDPGLRRGDGGAAASAPRWAAPEPVRRFEATLRQVEDWYRGAVIARERGNLSRAARVLGVDRSTLRRRADGARRDQPARER